MHTCCIYLYTYRPRVTHLFLWKESQVENSRSPLPYENVSNFVVIRRWTILPPHELVFLKNNHARKLLGIFSFPECQRFNSNNLDFVFLEVFALLISFHSVTSVSSLSPAWGHWVSQYFWPRLVLLLAYCPCFVLFIS